MHHNLAMGEQGEELAADYLSKQGYRIVERRFRCKLGEIDIIAQDGSQLLFVEVKTRKNTSFGSPSEAVSHKKQQNIIHTARQYLSYKRQQNSPCRFDIVEVILDKGKASVNHIPNAFGR